MKPVKYYRCKITNLLCDLALPDGSCGDTKTACELNCKKYDTRIPKEFVFR